MKDFLLWIGIYNVLGAFILMAMQAERVSDTILRKLTEIIGKPYSHGPFGSMWLWWAASANLFLGSVMICATRWGRLAQKEVAMLALGMYLILYWVMLLGARKPKYGRGIYVTHVLWLVQIIWGAWVVFSFDT